MAADQRERGLDGRGGRPGRRFRLRRGPGRRVRRGQRGCTERPAQGEEGSRREVLARLAPAVVLVVRSQPGSGAGRRNGPGRGGGRSSSGAPRRRGAARWAGGGRRRRRPPTPPGSRPGRPGCCSPSPSRARGRTPRRLPPIASMTWRLTARQKSAEAMQWLERAHRLDRSAREPARPSGPRPTRRHR